MPQENNHIMQSFTDVLTVSEDAPVHEYRGIAPITVDNLNDTISIDPSALSYISSSPTISATSAAGLDGKTNYTLDIVPSAVSYSGQNGVIIDNTNKTIEIDPAYRTIVTSTDETVGINETIDENGNTRYDLSVENTPGLSYSDGKGIDVNNILRTISIDDKVAYDCYVTPEQYGATGDGVHDDTVAFQAAVNAAQGSNKAVYLQNSYKISDVIYINSSTNIIGQSSRGTKIYLTDNAHFELKRDTGDHWVYEVRMKHFCIYADNQCDYCITSNHVASQCFFEDIYMEKATIACVKMRGSILYFKECYFYYSQTAAELRGNAIYFEGCNFWENTVGFRCYDESGISFLHLGNCWIEHQNVVFETNGNSITCFAEGTAFQGSTIPGYKMLIQSQDDKPNVNLSFVQCRFNYPYETGCLFKIVNEALGNGGNTLLKFSNCYTAIPVADALIDNSETNIGTLGVTYENSSPITHIFNIEGTRGAHVGPTMDYRHFTIFDSGLIIGKNKPAIDSVVNDRVGYMRFDEYNDQLYCVNGNGKQIGIPWKTSTYLPRLSKNNNNIAQDVDDIRETLNNLLYILKYQGKMLQQGNRDGSLSTEVTIGQNTYSVVKIGNYYWMAEDLREPIGTEGTDYVINENGAYLYKWSTLCQAPGIESDELLSIKPNDWKMPNETQFTNLTDNLVGSTKAEKAATLYGENAFSGFTGTNTTQFSAIANGYNNGAFVDVGTAAKYHSSNASIDMSTVGLFTLLGDDYSYSNGAGSASFRSCRLCMKI